MAGPSWWIQEAGSKAAGRASGGVGLGNGLGGLVEQEDGPDAGLLGGADGARAGAGGPLELGRTAGLELRIGAGLGKKLAGLLRLWASD